MTCGMQHFLVGQRSTVDSSMDFTTQELECFCLCFLRLFMSCDFLAATKDLFLSSLGSKFSICIIETLFNHLVFPRCWHGMVDNVLLQVEVQFPDLLYQAETLINRHSILEAY